MQAASTPAEETPTFAPVDQNPRATPLERVPFRWGYGRVEAAA
jgi:hypothetical protein